MTEQQKETLRKAAQLEPIAKQELRLMEQVHRLAAAALEIDKGMAELALTGTASSYDMNDAMSDLQFAMGGLIVPMFQLRCLMELPEVDFLTAISGDVDFEIGNRALLVYGLNGSPE